MPPPILFLAIFAAYLLGWIFVNVVLHKTEPEPVFGCPYLEGQEDHVSWWHIPIWLKQGDDASVTAYEHCRAALIVEEAKYFPKSQINLRCQSDKPQGDAEFALRLGEDPKKLPIAIRNEIPENASRSCPTYFTDEGFLQHNVREPRLESGTYKFKLEIRHEKLRWESSSYMLTVPGPRMSNGKFTLSKLPG